MYLSTYLLRYLGTPTYFAVDKEAGKAHIIDQICPLSQNLGTIIGPASTFDLRRRPSRRRT